MRRVHQEEFPRGLVLGISQALFQKQVKSRNTGVKATGSLLGRGTGSESPEWTHKRKLTEFNEMY